jgi:Protein of unknown function (DUF2380)
MRFYSPRLAWALLAAGLVCGGAARAAEALEPIAVIGFELVDDQPDPARDEAMRRRLAVIHARLEQGLQAQGLYRVVDTMPARELIEAVRERNAFVYRCNDCLGEIAQRLGTRLVVVGWVQRVSELILNINVSVRDARTDAEVLAKSVDLRGNNDESFERGIRFMLRDWSERRAANPRYGL